MPFSTVHDGWRNGRLGEDYERGRARLALTIVPLQPFYGITSISAYAIFCLQHIRRHITGRVLYPRCKQPPVAELDPDSKTLPAASHLDVRPLPVTQLKVFLPD